MKRGQKITLFAPAIVATGILGTILLPSQPARADLIKDTAVGAATGVVAGEILDRRSSTWKNAVGGAAAGAAVSATHNRNSGTLPSLIQDAAVGAAANAVTGEITNNSSLGNNAIKGAVTGVIVNVTKD
ncbi:hypothetical protein NIES593_03460 [Hydrococcus rivularis NIES-593]|uniref:YMGG-like Gly-zipper domain-containing protein n=1 Tax=Hydrococcus rivularis NIES-593 TaxID=1921803 RepID=A0A1U7HRD0_9CYAN|nr:YMGG-like glycine zipper-containing protein [Hydrococcus rivularis]OKH26142.1 hypothetical protein NIES593_03460 [Hydrococcus rivularis NIES-593]